MRYTVTAERGDGPVWVFQCKEQPGAISESRRLRDAPVLMQEAIAFVADVDESEVEIDLELVLPDSVSVEVSQAREAVRELMERQATVAALSRRAVRHLSEAGVSGADIAIALGVSPQRVSQLLHANDEQLSVEPALTGT